MISENGLKIIKEFEGFSSKPYLCSAGVPTIGYGATFYENGKKVKMSDAPITIDKANELLKFHVQRFADAVDRYVQRKINQNQYDALVSLCYNIGPVAFKNSRLLKYVNTQPDNENTITKGFLAWRFVGKKEIKGLKNRRLKEIKLYFAK